MVMLRIVLFCIVTFLVGLIVSHRMHTSGSSSIACCKYQQQSTQAEAVARVQDMMADDIVCMCNVCGGRWQVAVGSGSLRVASDA